MKNKVPDGVIVKKQGRHNQGINQINPNRWDSRQVEMKFDIVTQWMIAYAVRHIPLCRTCSDVGEDGVND
jgi:hypothetical protein